METARLRNRQFSGQTQALINTIMECLLQLAAKAESDRELEQGFEFPWGHQSFVSGLVSPLFSFFLRM
jgi:hypothetical protein